MHSKIKPLSPSDECLVSLVPGPHWGRLWGSACAFILLFACVRHDVPQVRWSGTLT